MNLVEIYPPTNMVKLAQMVKTAKMLEITKKAKMVKISKINMIKTQRAQIQKLDKAQCLT